MAEITKITAPVIPRENSGSKFRPASEQTFELNNPDKIGKSGEAGKGKINDHDPRDNPLRGQLNNDMVRMLMRDAGDLTQNLQKMFLIIQAGMSASDIMADPVIKQLFSQLFTSPDQLMKLLEQQDDSSVLFRGKAFEVLRDALVRFESHQGVKDAVVTLLKTFEQNVNSHNSIKTILYNATNILDFMFSADREQFAGYLAGLADMLLPPPTQPQAQVTVQQAQSSLADTIMNQAQVLEAKGEAAPEKQTFGKEVATQKEAANILKNNLLPLLGEIVVKYHQNAKIRDIVMVIVHNIVRVDKGTPEGLRDAVENLAQELKKVANLPENFAADMLKSLEGSAANARSVNNDIMEKISLLIGEVLRSDESSAPMIRQSENLLFSMLQNQGSMMGVLHFIFPMITADDRIFTEMYVDPESDENKGRDTDEVTRKIFVTAESENHGSFELCFWQTGDRVDFSMWTPEILVKPLASMKRTLGDMMQIHGFTMNSFSVEQFIQAHSVAQVFPRLLGRKVGIDVRI